VELNRANLWTIIQDRTVQQAIQGLGIRPPFDRIARQLIAREIDADFVIFGTVEAASVDTNPMEARVRLRVYAEDVRTGALYNGALVDGASVPRMGYKGDADILLEEALTRAAFNARQIMERFRPPEGTVLNTAIVGQSTLRAGLNVGARGGVRRGMDFVITRRGELVGFVRVDYVEAEYSAGVVTSNIQGVRPEDRARAVFSFESFPSGERNLERGLHTSRPDSGSVKWAQRKAGKKARPAALALADSHGAGTFEPMVAAEQDKDKGGPLVKENEERTTVENEDVTVEDTATHHRAARQSFLTGPAGKIVLGGALLMGILVIAGTQKDSTRPFEMEALLVQAGGCGGPTGIRVRWNRPRGVPTANTVPPGDTNSDLPTGILGYLLWRTDTTGGATSTPGVDVVGSTLGDLREFLDQINVTHTAPQVFPGRQPGTDPGTPADLAGVPGLIPGHRYRYQVMAAYRTIIPPNPDAPAGVDLLSPFSPYTNPATYIVPRLILQPAQGDTVDLNNLTVVWQTTEGANAYQVIISTDPEFRPNTTFKVGPVVEVVPPDLGGPLEASINAITVTNPRLVNARHLFISVIAWNTDDPLRPKPFGGVCYAPVGVLNATAPPPPAGGGGGGGGPTPPPGPVHKGKK